MIIVDRLKIKYNQRVPVECYFYRDNAGLGVDLIEPEGSQVHALEIKAGATMKCAITKACLVLHIFIL